MIGTDTFAYRRQLPHLSKNLKTYFVTFVTKDRRILEPEARDIVLRSCLHDHNKKYWLHCVVVMPDHAHFLLTTFEGVFLTRVMADTKSASAHLINRALHRSGPVWQIESFDHILRSEEKIVEKANYILNNPVRAGLVKNARDWPWSWSAVDPVK
jgi:REP element-mobilizing transposase RayT